MVDELPEVNISRRNGDQPLCFFFARFDWHQRRTRVVNFNNYYYDRAANVNRQSNVANVTSNVNAALSGATYHVTHKVLDTKSECPVPPTETPTETPVGYVAPTETPTP